MATLIGEEAITDRPFGHAIGGVGILDHPFAHTGAVDITEAIKGLSE